MVQEVELYSPVVTLSIEGVFSRWQILALLVAWIGFWAIVTAGILYLYAVLFADWVGFETAVLVGVGIIALATGSKTRNGT